MTRPFAEFYRRCRMVTERLWPTLIEPLRTREDAPSLSSTAVIRRRAGVAGR